MSGARRYIDELAARGRYHFTPEAAREALGGTKTAVMLALNRLARQGLVAHPAHGFYVIVPPEYRRLGCLPADQFIPALMEQLGIDYYVGLLSAAQYHGAAHHRPQEFQVVIGTKRRGIACGAVRVVFIVRKHLADVKTRPFNTPRGTVRVSTVETTVIDLIGYPHHAGGLEQAATVIAELAEQIDPERLVAAARTAPIPWAQRLGYLLDMAGKAEKAELLRRYVHEAARDITPLIPAMPREAAVRDAGWKLDVNADVEIEA
ncbi:type IV toxin-antitoxin system AbiEi family antitoxin [Ruegeria sp.]|uniref:type IV toxin-antitoxin system AbiEi family antitoxin n=1 Tax=Ruegeria sp. TaxID=1879320 RepID=UPI003AFFAEAE